MNTTTSLSGWRSACAAALLIGLLAGNWTPEAHARSLAAEASIAAPVPSTAKKVITHDVYANWRSVQGTVVSRDGQWAAWAQSSPDADGELVVRNLNDQREIRVPRGEKPVFSQDGKFVAFSVRPLKADLDKARKEKKKPEDSPKAGAGLLNLASGKTELLERVKQFAWPQEGPAILAVLMDAPEAKKEEKKPEAAKDEDDDQARPAAAAAAAGARKKDAGNEFILWHAADGKREKYQDVTDFAWAKNGGLLALNVKTTPKEAPKEAAKEAKKDEKNTKAEATADAKPAAENAPAKAAEVSRDGVWIIVPGSAAVQVFKGAGVTKHLVADEKGTQIAFLSSREDFQRKQAEKAAKKAEKSEKSDKPADAAAEKEDPAVFDLYHWQRDSKTDAAIAVNAATAGMPAGWGVSEFAEPGFSEDGARLFFGTAALPKAEPKDTPEPVKVDLWHWKDPELQSVQKIRADKDKQKNYRAVFHLADKRFVQLGTAEIPSVLVNENAGYALGVSDVPYKQLLSWDGSYRDYYAIDLKTGQAKKLAEKQRAFPSLSPSGQYVLGFDVNTYQWNAWRTSDGQRIDLTSKTRARFQDHEHDTPEPRSAYGYAGWTANDRSVVLYDRYDLWEIEPQTGKAVNLTAGAGQKAQTRLRYVNLENNRNEPMDDGPVVDSKALPAMPWMLSALADKDLSTGLYQLSAAGKEPRKLVQDAHLYSSLIKAKNADRVLFARQSFTEFPNLWSSDLNLNTPKQISDVNPQQKEYNWGTQELIEYTTTDGRKLRALLAKPENFDPAKKYPMMVYIYEKMTDNLHLHVPPGPSQNINVTRYLSNGYVVLRPDITYTTGHPGQSALKAVTGAVNKVVGMGFVDAKRIGIQGHSWGAYQINYLITQTNMFRAAEAGASMANMTSGYGGIRWGAGVSRAFQYETGQSRMGGTPWNKTKEYIENSPLFHIDKVQTPWLTKHNDEDDAVPWYQAIEFFTALRRLNKEAYWFNYNGEKHGLRDRENVKHYTVHMAEFFDHFLLGKPRPEWMEKPTPYLERGKRDVTPLFKPALKKASDPTVEKAATTSAEKTPAATQKAAE